MWRAGLGEHYIGCALPKAPGQCAHWLAGLPGPELHRRSVPKAQTFNGRGVAQRPPQPGPADGSVSPRAGGTQRARAARRAVAARRPALLPCHAPVLGRPSNARGRSRRGPCPPSATLPLGTKHARGSARAPLLRRGSARADEGTPPAAPPARGARPPAHRVPGLPGPEVHVCSARRSRQGWPGRGARPSASAFAAPWRTPEQDAVRGGKARAEAPARAQGPAYRHRPPLWRVARGAARALHGPRWAFAWSLVREVGALGEMRKGCQRSAVAS